MQAKKFWKTKNLTEFKVLNQLKSKILIVK